MSLTKNIEVDKIECDGPYSVQVRTATVILETPDDESEPSKELSRGYHRHVLHPSDDWNAQNEDGEYVQDARVRKICDAVFTDDIKTRWTDEMNKKKS